MTADAMVIELGVSALLLYIPRSMPATLPRAGVPKRGINNSPLLASGTSAVLWLVNEPKLSPCGLASSLNPFGLSVLLTK
jgi:hypothetical protein